MGSRTGAAVRAVGVDRLVLGLAAVVIVLGALAGQDRLDTAPGEQGLDALAAVLLAAGVALVAMGGIAPVLAAIGALGLTFVWYGAGYTSALVNVVAMAAFYRLGASPQQGAKVGVTVAAVAATFAVMAVWGDEGWAASANAAGYLVVAVLFGELLRSRRLLVDQYEERARRAEADAERRVAEERLRIARDLHDVLAHTVSVMNVQAGVAADSLERDPEVARQALNAIRTSGRDALGEVRATVAVLRSGHEEPTLAPSPGLDRVPMLVEALEAHGVRTHVDVDPSARTVSSLVSLTAFRVAQEAVTNVLRHSAASTVWMRIGRNSDRLTVEVRDDGVVGTSDPVPGLGLRGMAERVESIGGVLHHGRDGTGWVVLAELPAEVSTP